MRITASRKITERGRRVETASRKAEEKDGKVRLLHEMNKLSGKTASWHIEEVSRSVGPLGGRQHRGVEK